MISDIRASLVAATREATLPAAAPAAAPQQSAATVAADSAVLSSSAQSSPRRTLATLRAAVAAEAESLDKKLPEHVPGEVLVRTRPDATDKDVKSLASFYGLKVVEKFDIPAQMRDKFDGELYLMRARNDLRTSEGIALLSQEPRVAYAASNDVLRLIEPVEEKPAGVPTTLLAGETPAENVPNDLDSRLWGLRNQGQDGGKAGADISATKAWSVQTGKTDGPVIAVIDTGVDYTHPEIAGNIWNNPDKNAPDQHGYDFVNNDPDPMDDHSHGTHVSGTIGAKGNNGAGIVGVNWDAQIMGLKFLSAGGSGSTADAVRAVLYASEKGARITSNSWGGGVFNQALYDALKASPALHIFAAGNSAGDNDTRPSYPASYDLDNIVAVAASDRNDNKASFSCWGKRSVDVAAPGKDILSSVPGPDYKVYSGTSMATPHVAGVAGLIASTFPGITNDQIKSRLMNGVDRLPQWNNVVASGGRLNAANALETDTVAPAAPGDFRAVHAGSTQVQLEWTASGDDNWTGSASAYELRWSERPIVDDPSVREGAVSFEAANVVQTDAPQAAGTIENAAFSLTPSGQERTIYVALKIVDNVGNKSVMIPARVTVPAATVAFEDKMEGGTENWVAEQPWTLVDDGAQGKVWSSNATGTQDNDANTSLTTRRIDLSTLKNASLNFMLKKDLEDGFDFLNLEISEDGQNWTGLDKTSGSSDWAPQSLDLKPYEGKTIQLRWRVQTDGSVNSAGIKLDNVVIAGDPA